MKLSSRERSPGFPALAVVGIGTTVVASGASAGVTHAQVNVQVCALLPDTTTSARYVLFDAPDLSKAFKSAGLTFSVLNAQGSTSKQILLELMATRPAHPWPRLQTTGPRG